MISVTKVRELTLAAATSPGRLAHLSAASALVRAGAFLYVVADDEHHLAVFPAQGDAAGELIPVFAGDLPAGKKERKARKPDLEVLTRLPAFPEHAYGALLALGSGSRPNRRTGALLQLDALGAVVGRARMIDLSDIYAQLAAEFPALNIEGAVVIGDELRLLQRGSRRDPRNACISLRLRDVLPALGSTGSIGTAAMVQIESYDLGTVDGIPLGFSDAGALPDGALIFAAVAEDTEDNYEDGPCAGAAIGIIGTDGRLRFLERLDPGHKIEGIDAQVDGDAIELLLVTDADDEDVPACLLSARISR